MLATVFLVAATAKLGDRRAFADAVAGYRLLPPAWNRAVARLLPPLELAAAGLLFAGVATGVAAAGLGLLLIAFVVAVTVNLARGRRIDCGCFGATVERQLTWWTVARNAALAAAAAVVAADPPAALSLWPLASDPPGASTGDAAAMLVAGSGLVLAALVASAATAVRGAARGVPLEVVP